MMARGRKPKLTPEQVAEIERYIAADVSPQDTARSMNIPFHLVVYRYKKAKKGQYERSNHQG